MSMFVRYNVSSSSLTLTLTLLSILFMEESVRVVVSD
jgi:hypothetical protein